MWTSSAKEMLHCIIHCLSRWFPYGVNCYCTVYCVHALNTLISSKNKKTLSKRAPVPLHGSWMMGNSKALNDSKDRMRC